MYTVLLVNFGACFPSPVPWKSLWDRVHRIQIGAVRRSVWARGAALRCDRVQVRFARTASRWRSRWRLRRIDSKEAKDLTVSRLTSQEVVLNGLGDGCGLFGRDGVGHGPELLRFETRRVDRNVQERRGDQLGCWAFRCSTHATSKARGMFQL